MSKPDVDSIRQSPRQYCTVQDVEDLADYTMTLEIQLADNRKQNTLLLADIEALRQQLAAALAACKAKDVLLTEIDRGIPNWLQPPVTDALAIQPDDSALRAWLGEPVVCRSDGRCQYAIDHGAEGMGHCPEGKCCMPLYAPKGMK
jgi:hypothetical protein